MRIYGLDFTSAPGPGNPIACAACVLENQVLSVHCLAALVNFETFENFLGSEGPWVAGIDFPFGQPRKLIEDLGWPSSWEGYVGCTESLNMQAFERLLNDYTEERAPGDKHHLRAVDREAGARSPMMLHRVPVGRMFLRGAPRLSRSPACILPCRPNDDERVVLEAYPALVARRLIGRCSYKGNGPGDEADARIEARHRLLREVCSDSLARDYGVTVAIEPSMMVELVEQPGGDFLDAVLCGLQAAWGWSRREAGWGIPDCADPLEGWIVDPSLAPPPDRDRSH